MTRSSEFRRHQDYVQKEHVKNIVKNIWLDSTLSNDEKFIGKMAASPHPCSCEMCCNTRNLKMGSKKDRLTKKEKLSNFDLKHLDEIQ